MHDPSDATIPSGGARPLIEPAMRRTVGVRGAARFAAPRSVPTDASPGYQLLDETQADPTPPRAHDRALPVDLETIVLKCLQKDPERRYRSAGELSRDLGRLLRGEPIDARRDLAPYLLARSLARCRVGVIEAALIAVATLAGLGASLAFWRDAEAARARRWRPLTTRSATPRRPRDGAPATGAARPAGSSRPNALAARDRREERAGGGA